jgi:hypothetical protein
MIPADEAEGRVDSLYAALLRSETERHILATMLVELSNPDLPRQARVAMWKAAYEHGYAEPLADALREIVDAA